MGIDHSQKIITAVVSRTPATATYTLSRGGINHIIDISVSQAATAVVAKV